MSQQQSGINIFDTIRKFLWPVGVFRDASKGSKLERAAAYRHNRRNRGCLPQYMNNCLLVGVLLAGVGACLEHDHSLAAAILCWILVVYTMWELALLSALYLLLTAWEY